jgi:lipoprotein-anchoring transpeptidase ErfK/SrfK
VNAPKSRRTGRKLALLGAVCALAAAGGVFAAGPGMAHASFASEAASPERTTPGLAFPVVAPVQLDTLPADEAKQVNPAGPVTLKVKNGRIDRVALTSGSGDAVDGTLSPDASSWTATAPLKFNTRYSYTFAVVDAVGRTSNTTRSFTTVSTANEADAAIYPLDGMKVGVAQPLQITFSEPVLNRDAVEKAIKISSTSGQAGEFHWFSNSMVRYRPESFWTANSTISMDLQLFGVELGNGQVGNFNKKVTIHIGDKKVGIADAVAHTFTASVNDRPAGQWPATMGDTRFPSARGYLVFMEKYRVEHMDASTIGLKPGDPAYYGQLDVNYATRLTPSGEFIHQATDSAMPFLGKANLSHGCIGLGPDGAKWVFDNMTTGDVVQVVNTDGDFAAVDDGYGDWNIPWAQYAN